MNRVLVTGATGSVGRQLVSLLRANDCRVRALTRDPDTTAFPPDVEVARGNLIDSDSLGKCPDGVDAVFLMWTPSTDAMNAAVTMIADHARRVVLLSYPHKTPHPFFQQPESIGQMFTKIEQQIERSGLQWTFLRPGTFATNARRWWAPQIRSGDVVRWPYADAPTAPIHERDIAAVAVRALLEAGHDKSEYVLTGPESLGQLEQINIIGEVIGRSLRYEEISPEDALHEQHFSASASKTLLDAWAASLGQPACITSTVAEVTGTPARSFRNRVADHVEEFGSRFIEPPASALQ